MTFDKVSWFYDAIAGLVFGREWADIQLAPLKHISSSDRVLIVGGGTGQLLEQLHVNEVVFLDLSEKMLEKAKNRVCQSPVEFVNSDYLEWKTNRQFDVIVLQFFLDVFQQEQLRMAIEQSRNMLSEKGKVVVMDFQKAAWWRNNLVKVMYWFFRFTSGVKGQNLQDIHGEMIKGGFTYDIKEDGLSGWIFCATYQVSAE